MGLKKYKPRTPSLRFTTSLTFDEITRKAPEKSLNKGLSSSSGRDSNGRISVRRRGGGHKKKYRIVDFRRDKLNIPGTVFSIEYDPNRSANIALIHYADGEKRYILAPKGIAIGTEVQSGPNAAISVGNALPVENIPLGMTVHNIELQLGKGGQLARAAGASAVIAAKEGDYITVRLPSGESRLVFKKCYASLGEVGNEDHMNISLGKAGRSRWLGPRWSGSAPGGARR